MKAPCPSCNTMNASDLDISSGECFSCGHSFQFFQCKSLCFRFSESSEKLKKRKFRQKGWTCPKCHLHQTYENSRTILGPNTLLGRILLLQHSKNDEEKKNGKAMEILYGKSLNQWNQLDYILDRLYREKFSEWPFPVIDKLKVESRGKIISQPRGIARFRGVLFNDFMDFEGIQISSVRGHWRESKLGKIHWVNPHIRESGSLLSFMNWSILSWVMFPTYFFIFQNHWGSSGWKGHLLLAFIAALFADMTLMLVIFGLSVWIIAKLWKAL